MDLPKIVQTSIATAITKCHKMSWFCVILVASIKLTRLSHLEGIFCLRARKFLLLSTSALRKSAKTG